MVERLVLYRRVKWYLVQIGLEAGVGMVLQLHTWLLTRMGEALFTSDLSMVKHLDLYHQLKQYLVQIGLEAGVGTVTVLHM